MIDDGAGPDGAGQLGLRRGPWEHRSLVLKGYTPLLALAAVLALLIATVPSRGPDTPVVDAFGGVAPQAGRQTTAVEGQLPEDAGATPTTSAGGGSAPVARGTTNRAGRPLHGIDPREAGPWPWTHPATLDGNRSTCAPGGQWQDVVNRTRIPCVPRFEGDNLGATSQGVTREQITVVFDFGKKPDASQEAQARALGASDLFATQEQQEAGVKGYAKYFEKHYELYGRKINWVLYWSDCVPTDAVCARETVDQINTKYKPFYLILNTASSSPAFSEEAARLHIVTANGNFLPAATYAAHRPYHYSGTMDGTTVARHATDYWCKKLVNKAAARAGDPLLQAQRRKLGIVVPDDPDHRRNADALASNVSGGVCGAAGDKPVTYAYSLDLTTAQGQMPSIVAGLKNAGVTTVTCLCDAITPIFLTKAMDNQEYFPENFLSGVPAMCHDYLGRLYSPTQWQNAFGVCGRPQEVSVAESDHENAWRDVGLSDHPAYLTLNHFLWMRMAVFQLEWAGPNLTPFTLERGTLEAPQIGGFTAVANTPPGWKCCDPFVELWRFGPGAYTPLKDAKEVFYSTTEKSSIDGKPGAYVCYHQCRRYTEDGWPGGEPGS